MKRLGKGKEVHIKLNRDALHKIAKESDETQPWEVELVEKLTQNIEKQVQNAMIQRLLKMCAKKIHLKHDKWKKEALKEEDERKATFL